MQLTTLADTKSVFCRLSHAKSHGCTLLFSHPEFIPDISSSGLPIFSKSDLPQLAHDQLNNRVDLLEDGLRILRARAYDIVESGEVHQYVTRVMRLTRGKLLKQTDWSDWQHSEFLQLDQYDAQGMFRAPVAVTKMTRSSISYGHMALKPSTAERKHNACVMACLARDP
jgi:hypothetical protein